VQYENKSKCPLFCCKDFYVIFVNVVSHLHLSSTQQFSLFLVRAVTYNRSGNTDSNESCWRAREFCYVASCAEVHLVWLQRENLQNKTSQKWYWIWLWHTVIGRQTFLLKNDHNTGDITNKNCTEWANYTHCWPAVPVVHRLRQTDTTHITEDFNTLSIFIFLFFEIIQLLMEETNRVPLLGHTEWRKIPTAWSDCSEMYLFMAVTVQVEHDQSDTLKNYWYTQEQVYILFYTNITRQNSFFHIHIYLPEFLWQQKRP